MNIDAVVARMSAIQTRMVSLGLAPASTDGASFSSALNDASGVSDTATSALSSALGATGSTGTAGSSVAGSAVVASAEKYLGVPYVFGGTTTSGLDCSGLVQKAYGDLGISLPRLAADQAHAGTAVASLADAKPGDILAFGDPAYHVAIYVGDNKMIAAPEPGDKVKIQDVYQTPTSIRRVVGQQSAGQQSVGTGTASSGTSASGLAGVSQYASIFAQDERKFSLPAGLLAAVAQTESGGNALAVSPAGAQGLMQLMPSTAKGLGVNPWDPAQAVSGAAQLLSNYLNKFGSVPLALAAYNAGPGAVEQYGGVPPYTETQNYVSKISTLMAGAAA